METQATPNGRNPFKKASMNKGRANNQLKAQKAVKETAGQSGWTPLGLTLRNGNDKVPCHALVQRIEGAH